jgi:hypothetical protein
MECHKSLGPTILRLETGYIIITGVSQQLQVKCGMEIIREFHIQMENLTNTLGSIQAKLPCSCQLVDNHKILYTEYINCDKNILQLNHIIPAEWVDLNKNEGQEQQIISNTDLYINPY